MIKTIAKFAYLFFKLASEYYEKVYRLSLENPLPFKNWFDGANRVYFPLHRIDDITQSDQEVIDLLKEYGCEVTDYIAGYCQQGNRTMRIGKFIEKIKKEEIKKLQDKFNQGEIYNLERDTKEIIDFLNTILSQFNASSIRAAKKSQLFVVISQDPYDIAHMSTGRNWTSCMNLETGSNKESAYCEVKNGGLVAYLIYENDKNIDKPLARIHIRRFDSLDGKSIAILEDSVYGNDTEGFFEAVENWIDSKQGDIPAGPYKMQGGEWSDTFSSSYMQTPTDPETIRKWMMEEELEGSKDEYWVVSDLMYEDVHDELGVDIEDFTRKFKTEEEAKHYLDIISWNESDEYEREAVGGGWDEIDKGGNFVQKRFELDKMTDDYRSQMRQAAVKKVIDAEKGVYDADVLSAVKEFVFQAYSSMGLKNAFIKKYPELLTEEEIGSLDDYDNIKFIKALPPAQRDPYIQSWMFSITSILDDPASLMDENIEQYRARGGSWHEDADMKISIKLEDSIFRPLHELAEQLPEPLIRKLVNLKSSLSNFGVDFEKSDNGKRILASIAHLFAMKKADTPTVQNFYKSLFPYWGFSQKSLGKYDVININTLGHSIGFLGENGGEFLPFLRQKLEEVKQIQCEERICKDDKEKEIESYLWAIDAIETGKGYSTKYKFS